MKHIHIFKLLLCVLVLVLIRKFLIEINDEMMILLPYEKYSIEHQVKRIGKL